MDAPSGPWLTVRLQKLGCCTLLHASRRGRKPFLGKRERKGCFVWRACKLKSGGDDDDTHGIFDLGTHKHVENCDPHSSGLARQMERPEICTSSLNFIADGV